MKKLKKVISRLVEISFNQKGLDQDKIRQISTALIKLPKSQTIPSLSLYLKLLKAELKNRTLIIESATPLSTLQKNQILNSFKDQQIIDTQSNLNPSLLGGVKIKIGSTVFDTTLTGKIEQLRGAIINL